MDQERQFRRLTISDLPLILKMNDSFRSGLINEENTKQFLLNPMNWFFACIHGDQIIGFAQGYELNRLDERGNMMYVHEIGVLPQYQRQGIGFQMLSALKDMCKAKCLCKFFLFTQKTNTAACRLYEKAGGKKMIDTDNGDVDIGYFFNEF